MARDFIAVSMPPSARVRSPRKDDPVKKTGTRGKTEQKGLQRQPVSDAGEWITKAQAARMRGVTRQAIAKLVSKGKFTTLEIAGHKLVKRADVEAYKPEPGGRPARS
ncbi:MAG: helix-turn-helix domain-containing protein [Terrimicrobiaceae bacterium]|nr:helix-turn-helix domain-containing protein [Terrimicrobiaceae bacterium]